MIFLRRETWSLLEWFESEWKIDYFYAAKIRQHNQWIRNIFSCKENSPSRASSNFLAIVLMLPFDGMYQPYKLAVQINCDDLLLVPAFEYKDIYNKGCWVCSTRHNLTLQVTWYHKFLIFFFLHHIRWLKLLNLLQLHFHLQEPGLYSYLFLPHFNHFCIAAKCGHVHHIANGRKIGFSTWKEREVLICISTYNV